MRTLLTSTLLAAALAVAVPAQAHGGPPWKHGHGHGYAHGHYKHHGHARKYHHGRHHRRHVVREEVHNYYYDGYPAVASVPPGVHVVFPNIFLPFP